MPTYEAPAISRAAPESVWETWVDVDGWSEGDHVESASLDGEFRPGTVLRTKAKGLPRAKLTLTRVERPHLWVNESRSPGVRMTFDHLVEPVEAGTRVTERMLIEGPLARVVSALMGRRMEAVLDSSVAHVAQRAERAEAAAPAAPEPPPA